MKYSGAQIKAVTDVLFGWLENTRIEIHVPAYTALLVKRCLEIEAEKNSCTLEALSFSWDTLHPIIAACFSIASDNLDDHFLDTQSYATLFSLPTKTLDCALVDVLKRLDGYKPTNEEVVRLSDRLDTIEEELSPQQDTHLESNLLERRLPLQIGDKSEEDSDTEEGPTSTAISNSTTVRSFSCSKEEEPDPVHKFFSRLCMNYLSSLRYPAY